MKRILQATIFLALLLAVSQQVNNEFAKAFKYEAVTNDTIRGDTHIVCATMYSPVVSQCDKDPLTTAGMYRIPPDKASEQKWIAMSRDLISRWGGKFRYGDLVEIKGAGHKDGIYRVVDTMNKRFTNRIDFLETAGTQRYKFNQVTLTKIQWKTNNINQSESQQAERVNTSAA